MRIDLPGDDPRLPMQERVGLGVIRLRIRAGTDVPGVYAPQCVMIDTSVYGDSGSLSLGGQHDR